MAPTDWDFQLPLGKPLSGIPALVPAPLEEGCGLAPQAECAVCSGSLLPSLSLLLEG